MNSYQLRVVSRDENSRFRRIRSTRSDSLISSACFSASLTCKYPCLCVKMNERFHKNELDFDVNVVPSRCCDGLRKEGSMKMCCDDIFQNN